MRGPKIPTLLLIFLVVILFLTVIFYAWHGETVSVRSGFVCLSLAVVLVAIIALVACCIALGCMGEYMGSFIVFVMWLFATVVYYTIGTCL